MPASHRPASTGMSDRLKPESVTGLAGIRIQDPILGRFISADPFIQAPFNTQSHNRYSYVWNNPTSYIDPSGFLCFNFFGLFSFGSTCPGGGARPDVLDEGAIFHTGISQEEWDAMQAMFDEMDAESDSYAGAGYGGIGAGAIAAAQIGGPTVAPPTTQVFGTPQHTNGPEGAEHARLSRQAGQQMIDSGEYTEVHYNRELRTVSRGASSSDLRADVYGVRHNGVIDMVEVASPSQSPDSQAAKQLTMRESLPAEMRGTTRTVVPANHPSQLQRSIGGRAVRGVGVLGVLQSVLGLQSYFEAIEQNPNMGFWERMYRFAGIYDIAIEGGMTFPPTYPETI